MLNAVTSRTCLALNRKGDRRKPGKVSFAAHAYGT